MKMSRVIGVVVVLGVVGAGAYFATRQEAKEPERVIVTDARIETVTKTVRAIGHVEPVTMVNVSANVTGDLLELHIKEGDKVKRGDRLAEIDRERMLAVFRQAEANTRSLQATVELERATLERTNAEAARTKKLHAQGLGTDTELEQSNSEVAITKARLEAAVQRVAQAKASLDEAKDRLDKTRVTAPIDGTVISLKKKRGERIRGSDLSEDILLTLAPLAAMQVEVEVSEQDVVSIREGQATEIEIDAIEGSKIDGQVVEIANSADIKNRGTEMETTSFRVKVSVGEIPEALRPGMTASVSIITDVHENVVAVPIEAVTARLPDQLEIKTKTEEKSGLFDRARIDEDEDNRTLRRRQKPVEIVFVVADGVAEARRVTTGIASDLDLEITDGLESGETIVIGPYRALSKTLGPGTPVEIGQRAKLEAPTPPIAQER